MWPPEWAPQPHWARVGVGAIPQPSRPRVRTTTAVVTGTGARAAQSALPPMLQLGWTLPHQPASSRRQAASPRPCSLPARPLTLRMAGPLPPLLPPWRRERLASAPDPVVCGRAGEYPATKTYGLCDRRFHAAWSQDAPWEGMIAAERSGGAAFRALWMGATFGRRRGRRRREASGERGEAQVLAWLRMTIFCIDGTTSWCWHRQGGRNPATRYVLEVVSITG